MIKLSIIIPAYNEARALPTTLAALSRSIELCNKECQVVVVDNGSEDDTGHVATHAGVSLVYEPRPGIGIARNAGARAADGDFLLFIDADVITSRFALRVMVEAIEQEDLKLGGLRAIYSPRKLSSWFICAYWDWRRSKGGAPQGVAQFVARNIFEAVGGYDEMLRMSEDIEFYHRAARYLASKECKHPRILEDAIVWPSSRRYDRWGTLKSLFYQNPIVAGFALRSRRFWRAWRTHTIR